MKVKYLKKNNRKNRKTQLVILSFLAFIFLITKLKYRSQEVSYVSVENITKIDRKNYPSVKNFDKIDWNDWNFIEYEKNRVGIGEQGKPVILTDSKDLVLNQAIRDVEGLSGLISDKISVNRSVPDFRPEECKRKKYLMHLPKVSIVMIFFDEYQSILYRSLHSIYNRTPHQLIQEIILVNDKSTRDYLYEPLQKYVEQNFPGMIRILNLKERSGLIRAKMEGAKVATGEVLVFLDAHIEVNVNWLPPLLEPIVLNPLASTVPLIEDITYDSLEYYDGGYGYRGVFDWKFIYRILPKWIGKPDEPSESPLMLGGLFAINRKYFWDLGAYDEGLRIWNGENYELSFKLWLCGGSILEVPCSRVGHIFRNKFAYREKEFEKYDFEARNFKRIAEVWMDEYKEILYKRNSERFANIDAGDLSKQKLIREKLQCKPFQYFFDVVAPDLLKKYPINPDPDFAYGAIISEAGDNLCLDTMFRDSDEPLGIYKCEENLVNPMDTQFFNFTWERFIVNQDLCLDGETAGLYYCDDSFTGHFWKYDLDTHQLISEVDYKKVCLTAHVWNSSLAVLPCNKTNPYQKWNWSFKNETALRKLK